MPERGHARGEGAQAAHEIRGGAVAVDQIHALRAHEGGQGAREARGAKHVGREARAAHGPRRREVLALHRAGPGLHGVLEEVGVDEQLVGAARAAVEPGDLVLAGQEHDAVHGAGREVREDGMQAAARPAVARRVVDEEHPRGAHVRSSLQT